MKYYILLKIPSPDTEFFIEVGLDYEIPFHPNLTDEITVADFPCKINRIYYDIDYVDNITIETEATQNLYVKKGMEPQKIHECMQREWQELKKWCKDSGKEILLNDYYMNPEFPYDERKDYD